VLAGLGLLLALVGLSLWGLATVVRASGEINGFFVVGYLLIFLGAILVMAGVASLRHASLRPFLIGLGALWVYSALSWSPALIPAISDAVSAAVAAAPPVLEAVLNQVIGALLLIGTLVVMVIGLVVSFVIAPVFLFRHTRDRPRSP